MVSFRLEAQFATYHEIHKNKFMRPLFGHMYDLYVIAKKTKWNGYLLQRNIWKYNLMDPFLNVFNAWFSLICVCSASPVDTTWSPQYEHGFILSVWPKFSRWSSSSSWLGRWFSQVLPLVPSSLTLHNWHPISILWRKSCGLSDSEGWKS